MIAVAIVAGLACTGVAYQIIGTWRDAHRFHQRGRFVQAGNVRLNIDCSGRGNPTVILESASETPGLGWFLVQPEVAKFARVCSYDRAGLGWSDPGPEPRTTSQIAIELKALLDGSGEKGPFVLVGHSFGGYIVRVFTHRYPEDVAGVVLVEASHDDESDRINTLLPEALRQQEKRNNDWDETFSRITTPFSIYLGIERLEVAAESYSQEFLYLGQQRKARNAFDAEHRAASESIAQVRSAGNLGERPLIVLTAGKPYEPDPLLTNEQMRRQNDLWIHDLQSQEARLSTRGKQIIVTDSGHMMIYERPDAVVSAINEVWSVVHSVE